MTLEVPLSVEIEQLRAKCRDDTVTPEELHAILIKLRAGRLTAASAPVKSRKSAAKVDTTTLLDDL